MNIPPDRLPPLRNAGRARLPAAIPGVVRSIALVVAMRLWLGLGVLFAPRADAAPAEGLLSAQAWVESLPDTVVDHALESLWTTVPGAARRTPDSARRSALLGYLSGRIPGVRILRGDASPETPVPEASSSDFYAEILPERSAYVHLGRLDAAVCGRLDGAMEDWKRLGILRVVVDLRSSDRGDSLELAAQIAGRFLPKDAPLFSVLRGDGGDGRDENKQSASDGPQLNAWSSPWASSQQAAPPLLAVLVGESTAGPAEALAAVLKFRAHAVLIGHPTRGEAADFTELSLGDYGRLRVPVAEPVWTSSDARGRLLLGSPIQPDIHTGDASAVVAAVLAAEARAGKVAPFVAEVERLRTNEAALVAGRNPELEESIRRARRAKTATDSAPLRDSGLRAALDFFKGWDVLRPR